MSLFKKITLLLFTLCILALPVAALADNYGLSATADASGLTKRYPSDVPTLIGNVIGTALSMIAVIFFILMVYGGFLWMTAHGDSGQVDKAKDTIIAAIIGIIVVLASYAITNFVFSATKGAGGAGGGGGGAAAGGGAGAGGGAPQQILCCQRDINLRDPAILRTVVPDENACLQLDQPLCQGQLDGNICSVIIVEKAADCVNTP